MNTDLKIIKKYYGEKMMHLCRELFPTILEQENVLSSFLLKKFYPSHRLYLDLVKNDLKVQFKDFVDSNILKEAEKESLENNKTVEELFHEKGYNIYHCHNNDDVLSFKKYYKKGEELCTFNDEYRIKNYEIFFAVKENVDEIKREDFNNPKREDEYGTSVMSLQFSKNESHRLSIKNRYNHTVVNPDATFHNNLDNIALGLTDAFAKEYGMVQQYRNKNFEIPSYVFCNGTYYKYNYEDFNCYYCPNNIYIDGWGIIHQLEKEKYLFMDYFVLDLRSKDFFHSSDNSFVSTIGNIEKINIINKKYGKDVIIKSDIGNEDIIISLDKESRIIAYINNNIEEIGSYFLHKNKTLKYIEIKNVKQIGNYFLDENRNSLKEIVAPNLKNIYNGFLSNNNSLSILSLPKLEYIGDDFFKYNNTISSLYSPNLKTVRNNFLAANQKLTTIFFPNLEYCGDCFYRSTQADVIYVPNLEICGEDFCEHDYYVNLLYAPKLSIINSYFMHFNNVIDNMYMPNLEQSSLEGVLINNEMLSNILFQHFSTLGSTPKESYENAVKTLIKKKSNDFISK